MNKANCKHCGNSYTQSRYRQHIESCSKIHNFIKELDDYQTSPRDVAIALGYNVSGNAYVKIRRAFKRLGIKPKHNGLGRPTLKPKKKKPRTNCECGFILMNGKCMNCEFYEDWRTGNV